MERSQRGKPGGILGLCDLIESHGEAIEYDLITLGLRLDQLGDGLSWRDLWVIVRQSPVDSAFARSSAGESVAWGLSEHLLAAVVNALNTANWQRGGGKGSRPKPIKPPGSSNKDQSYGTKTGAIPISEFNQWWEGGT